jgi:hypothetical protein
MSSILGSLAEVVKILRGTVRRVGGWVGDRVFDLSQREAEIVLVVIIN